MDVRTFFGQSTLFTSAGVGRGTNDANNKAREAILCNLYSSTDPSLQWLRTAWVACLSALCPLSYDSVSVTQVGGRSANYDFTISFRVGDTVVHSVNAEFKHNASRIDTLPEYFSPAADKPYFPRLYAHAFYDRLDEICAIYPGLADHKPDREVYLKLVHNNDYNRHPFFRTLYDMEAAGTPAQKQQKQTIVRTSIQDYLQQYASQLDIAQLSQDIQTRQSGKVFILWDLATREFKLDKLSDDEMEITHVETIKNGNTLVAMSKAGTRHNMLLRWKNHLGILYPAWQISLSR
jgi:hypothetical protein